MTRLIDISVPAVTLAAASAGDRAAQATIYVAVAPAVFCLIRRMVGDRATAEDLFQDSLLAAFEHLPQFRGDAPFGAWLRRIAVSRCLMHLRSPWQRARLALSADPDSPQLQPQPAGPGDPGLADLIDIERAHATLSATARSVLWLFEVEGYSHEEIAQGFGRSCSFSKSQLARAHRALAQQLESGSATLPRENLCATLPRTS
jgi:RNA polymerase sigma factor (sigma-70 family)